MAIDKRKRLLAFSKELANVDGLVEGLKCISQNAKFIMESERCSIFLYDSRKSELWTTLADGIDRIIIPSDIGIIGRVIKIQKVLFENEPYDNPYFLSDIDMQTGFFTKNLIAAPIFDSYGDIIGVLELLNKDTLYNKDDASFIHFLAHYISGFIELHLTR